MHVLYREALAFDDSGSMLGSMSDLNPPPFFMAARFAASRIFEARLLTSPLLVAVVDRGADAEAESGVEPGEQEKTCYT